MFYHGSPISGLKVIRPSETKKKNKKENANVYITKSEAVALLYLVDNFEYTYGFEDGVVTYYEYFPNALKIIYKGKNGSIYRLANDIYEKTTIPFEYISHNDVRVIEEIKVNDVYDRLLQLEKEEKIIIKRYNEHSDEFKKIIRNQEIAEIFQKKLTKNDSNEAKYMKIHYNDAFEETKKMEYISGKLRIVQGSLIIITSALSFLAIILEDMDNYPNYWWILLPFVLLIIVSIIIQVVQRKGNR